MQIFPSDEEVEQAADLLARKYKASPQLLGKLFGIAQRDQANSILKSLGSERLTQLSVARLLVQQKGPELFTGSRKRTYQLRQHLLEQLPDEEIEKLFRRHRPGNSNITIPARMRKPLAEKKWHAGKTWAKDFVMALGFPAIFSGVVRQKKYPLFRMFLHWRFLQSW